LVPSANNVCQGTTITFTASASNAGASPTFNWYVNGASAPGSSNSAIYTTNSLNNGDEVVVEVISGNGCSGTQSRDTVTMIINPVPSVSISANPGLTVCEGDAITFTANVTGSGPFTYQWKVTFTALASMPSTYQWYVNGTAVSGATGVTYSTNSLNDGDVVHVVATSLAGCSGPSSSSTPISITVQGSPTVTITASDTTICEQIVLRI